ncbi:MAG TPA: twin-arginine translocation signal domain-containing protein [Planctomycetaceae bacterium]|nr:twin-arginine translocation signal domain-containing protein [Planctomycetaceae bacterium]
MSSSKTTSRRNFLKGSATVVGATLAGGLTIARSAHAAGSDVIKVVLIGAGGRGTGAVSQQMNADKNVKLIAIADAFETKAKAAAEKLKKRYPDQVDVPPCCIFSGLDAYRKALDNDADLATIATPPGFRPQQYKAAIEAGKHVFMEKPCCVDGPGYKILMEANKLADQKGLFVRVGLQRRHQPNYMETIKRIHDGAIGRVLFTRVYWNGGGIWNRRRQKLAETLGREPTEMEYQVWNWYHFCWLSGDNICEQHIHNIDIGNWVQDAHPVEANGMGGCTARYLGENKGTGQIFDHHFVEFTYANGAKMFSQCRHMKGCWNSVSEAAHGTKGTSNCSGAIEGENPWRYRGPGVSGHQQEQTDLIADLRAGRRGQNEGYYGATSSMTSVLGRLANYSGKVIKWEDAVEKGVSEFPEVLEWDAPAPVQKNEEGDYPIPLPGIYNPFVS